MSEVGAAPAGTPSAGGDITHIDVTPHPARDARTPKPVTPPAPAAAAPKHGAPPTTTAKAPASAPKGATPTGNGAQAQARALGQVAPTPPKSAAPGREPVMTKVKLPDGTETEVDISADIERTLAGLKRKLKANGQEREVTLAELEQAFPLAEHARTKAYEATEASKKLASQQQAVENLGKALRDPKQAPALLRKLLGDEGYRDMIERDLAETIKRESMSPEERQRIEDRERFERDVRSKETDLERREREFNERVEGEKQQRIATQARQLQAQYARDFPIHLKAAGAPVTPRTVALMAEAKASALREGLPHDDAALARQVAKEMRELASHFGSSLSGDELAETAPELTRKVEERAVARARAAPGAKPITAQGKAAVPAEVRTPDQLRRFLREQDKIAEQRMGRR